MGLRGSVTQVLNISWPTVIIAMVVFISWRAVYYLTNDEKLVFYHETIYISFMIYILALFQVVTAGEVNHFNVDGFNLIPFKELFRYPVGSKLFLTNVLGNILLFLPYGFFINYFTKNKKPSVSFLLGLILSLTIESTQSLIGRIFDIDDILLNSIGVMLGFSIYKLVDKIIHDYKHKELVLNILSFMILISYVLFLYYWSIG